MRRFCHRHTRTLCAQKKKKKKFKRVFSTPNTRYFFYDKFSSFHLAPRIIITAWTTDETEKIIVCRALCARKSIIQSLLFG